MRCHTFPAYLIGLLLLFASCKKQINQIENLPSEVGAFASSSVLVRNASQLAIFGDANFSNAFVKKLAMPSEDSATLIVVPIFLQKKVVALLEAVRLPSGKLPNADDYAVNVVDLTLFDESSLSGVVKMYDLNCDFFAYSIVTIERNVIKSWNSRGLTPELNAKYSSSNYNKNSKSEPWGRNVARKKNEAICKLCDSNANHNISFSECYKCVSDAIAADGMSTFICELPVVGWVECWVSKTATCMVVSAQY